MAGIRKPGIYNLSREDYFADPVYVPSLTSTGARKLAGQGASCPAKFRYEMDHPKEPSAVFDIGNAAHDVLVNGFDHVVVADADDWRTAAARELRDSARNEGKFPVLRPQMDAIQQMVGALRSHEWANLLFSHGKGEQTLVWRDRETGVWCRAMLDWLPERSNIFPDYKTCLSAHPDAIAKAVYNYGYHQQAAWYLDGIEALGLDKDPKFVLVFQEKEPPHLVTVAELQPNDIGWGLIQNRKAREIFAECLRTGEWPSYVDEVVQLSIPEFAERQLQKQHDAGAYALSMKFHEPLGVEG